jgi:hypothetical protein
MKCIYYKQCELYDKDSVTCNEDGGMYAYNGFNFVPATCYKMFKIMEGKDVRRNK